MPSCLQLAPEGGPSSVQAARQAAQQLVDQLGDDQRALEAARVALTRARQLDREALAAAMRGGTGEEAVSDTQVEKAEADVRKHERVVAARELAALDTDRSYREAISAQGDQWLRSAERAAEKVLATTERHVTQLASDVAALGEAAALVHWLRTDGLAQGLPVRPVGLAVAKSSAFSQASSEPVTLPQALNWVAEAIQRTRELSAASEREPEPQSQAPAQPLASAST
jgi:hypothetical protein